MIKKYFNYNTTYENCLNYLQIVIFRFGFVYRIIE